MLTLVRLDFVLGSCYQFLRRGRKPGKDRGRKGYCDAVATVRTVGEHAMDGGGELRGTVVSPVEVRVVADHAIVVSREGDKVNISVTDGFEVGCKTLTSEQVDELIIALASLRPKV